jgi:ATP-dependent protease HslVU (ClpYQ) peptidase subunit
MGCDSLMTSFGSTKITVESPSKISAIPIAETSEQVLVGVTGSAEVLCTIMRGLEHVSLTSNEHPLRCIKAALNTALEGDEPWAGFMTASDEILIAIADRVYYIVNQATCVEVGSEFFSIGSGREYALGALFASAKLADPRDTWADFPLKQVEAALEAAEMFDINVRGPFSYYSTKSGALDKELGRGKR